MSLSVPDMPRHRCDGQRYNKGSHGSSLVKYSQPISPWERYSMRDSNSPIFIISTRPRQTRGRPAGARQEPMNGRALGRFPLPAGYQTKQIQRILWLVYFMRFLAVFYGVRITHQYSLDRAYCLYQALKLCQNIQVYNNNLLISHKIRIRKLIF